MSTKTQERSMQGAATRRVMAWALLGAVVLVAALGRGLWGAWQPQPAGTVALLPASVAVASRAEAGPADSLASSTARAGQVAGLAWAASQATSAAAPDADVPDANALAYLAVRRSLAQERRLDRWVEAQLQRKPWSPALVVALGDVITACRKALFEPGSDGLPGYLASVAELQVRCGMAAWPSSRWERAAQAVWPSWDELVKQSNALQSAEQWPQYWSHARLFDPNPVSEALPAPQGKTRTYFGLTEKAPAAWAFEHVYAQQWGDVWSGPVSGRSTVMLLRCMQRPGPACMGPEQGMREMLGLESRPDALNKQFTAQVNRALPQARAYLTQPTVAAVALK